MKDFDTSPVEVEHLAVDAAVLFVDTWTEHCTGWMPSVLDRTDSGTGRTETYPACSILGIGRSGMGRKGRPESASAEWS